ncbi:MAG: serine hydrolase [Bacteroidota bacterium]
MKFVFNYVRIKPFRALLVIKVKAMRLHLLVYMLMGVTLSCFSQNASLYFPPISGEEWETIDPEESGWNTAAIPDLYNFLEQANTKGFIVLKDGKIALEQYFGTFTQDSVWFWASAGKSLTAVLIGIAQEEGQLALSDKTSDYLGKGWTNLEEEKEDLITIWNQLTMTSGMDERIFTCKTPGCLRYVADAGTRWSYHNGPYSLLRDVLENATELDFNAYTNQSIKSKIGMKGLWIASGDNNLFVSRPRDMARFGLMILNEGYWAEEAILSDSVYFNQMVNSSQAINPSYGYLWWLNGKESFIPPSPTISMEGNIAPFAPEDMIVAAGAQGQLACIVPSQNLLVIRMGEESSEDFVPLGFQNEMWLELNKVLNLSTSTSEFEPLEASVFPNPASNILNVIVPESDDFEVRIYDLMGRLKKRENESQIYINDLNSGMYVVEVSIGSKVFFDRIMKK